MPSLSLKARLSISLVGLVSILVLAQSLLSLHGMARATFADAFDRADSIAQQVRNIVLQRVSEQTAQLGSPPATLEESKRLWTEMVKRDQALSSLLEKTLATSSSVVEMLVSGESGEVLAASNPSRIGTVARNLPDFAAWHSRPLWDKLLEVFSRRKDYAITVPLGVPGEEKPIFTIRVVISSVLLRNTVLPQVRNMALMLAASLLTTMLLAGLFSNLVLGSLARISQKIDLISTGKFAAQPVAPLKESKEFADVQSKLDMLSEQYRGAKEDVIQMRSNIEGMLQRLEEAVLLFDAEDRLVLSGVQAERLLGMPRWKMMGRKIEEIFDGSSALGLAVQDAVRQQRPLRDQAVLLEDNGEPAARLLVSVEPLEQFPGHRRMGTLVTLRDAETRRQIQTHLDVSTRLAAISRLTGGVAHEIKNPLNAIALHLEVLKSKVPEPSGVERELEVIGTEIRRLDRVVKTFLDFTRPMELNLEDVDLTQLTREVANLVRPEAERNHVKVELQAKLESAIFRGDRDLLKQAILNIVANGIEAMPGGGALRIQIQNVLEEYILTVSDEGAGIAPELRDKIFNLYFSTKEKGSGIGLAMTFRAVQLHDGSIDFSSEPGKGSTFRLRFPAVVRRTLTTAADA